MPLKRHRAGRSHWLLEFPGGVGREEVAVLAARGARVTSYVSGAAVAVSVEDSTDPASLGALRAVRLSAQDKVSPLLAAGERDAFVVEFHADVPDEEAQSLVREAGLDLLEHPDVLPHQALVAGGPIQVAALGEWDEVAYIFPASADLVSGARVEACPGALTEQGLAAQYVKAGAGWGGGVLHYFFSNTTGKLDRSTVESESLRAFAEWGRYAPLDFTPGSGPAAARTIAILFARGAHGDGYAFDGPGKVLAHTFYPAPPNSEPLAGDMHLDDDEDWHTGKIVDLFTVVLHEAGHALGLGHSDRPGSVMYPYYRQAAGLTADDIAGIQELYGSRETPADPPATPADPPADPKPPVIPPAQPVLALAIRQPAAAGPATTAATVALAGTVENASGTVQVSWQSDRGPAGQAVGGANWTVAAVPLSVGANTLTVTASDQAGGRASRAITVTRQEVRPADTTAPPAVRITSPALTIVSTSLAAITLRGTAGEGTASVTWANSAGGVGTAAGTTAWTAADVPLSSGTNTVTVRASNTAGASAWRTVTVVRR